MVTTNQILAATGLKSAKTLTRWQKAGIIPKPQVGTHPSGRGKVAYYPHWVLEHCQRIGELQKQGHSLQAAAALALKVDRLRAAIEELEAKLSAATLLAGKSIQQKDGSKTDLLALAHVIILHDLKPFLEGEDLRRVLLEEMYAAGAAGEALDLLRAGFNPVLITDGTRVEVLADFLISHRLTELGAAPKPLVVLPLVPTLQLLLPEVVAKLLSRPLVKPAPKILAREGDATVEYSIVLTEAVPGFDLVSGSAEESAIENSGEDERDDQDDSKSFSQT
jgi:hypothetical protein